MITIKKLTKIYNNNEIYKNYSLTIPNGIICIEGDNGIGKSTLLNCIANMTDYKGIIQNNATNISYATSNDYLYDYLSAKENITYFGQIFDQEKNFQQKCENLLKKFNFENKQINYITNNLSSGNRSKLFLAIVLSLKSDLILLDEPLTNLDFNSQEIVMEYIKTLPNNVIYITHIEKFKQIATQIIHIENTIIEN